MNTNEMCANTPGSGHEASSLFFTKAPGEDHYKVYARYPNDPSWIPVQVAWPATPDLQQVRDADRNIATDSGSYEDAHIYLRSADGNNMTTALFSNAEGGGIQSGNADGFSPLNLQPDGGTLNYGGEEVATKNFVHESVTGGTGYLFSDGNSLIYDPYTMVKAAVNYRADMASVNQNTITYHYGSEPDNPANGRSGYSINGSAGGVSSVQIFVGTGTSAGNNPDEFFWRGNNLGGIGWPGPWRQVASRDWTEANTIKNQSGTIQSGDFRISGTGVAGTGLSVQGSYSDGAININPHTIDLSRGGNGFTFLDFQGAHVGTVINSMLTAPLKFRYHNNSNQQMVFDSTLMIGVADGYTGTGERLQVNGSIKQSAVTGSMLKADADGKIVAATPGTDYATSSGITKQIVTPTGFGGDHTVGSKDTRGTNLTPQQYGQVKDVGGVSYEFKESVSDMGLPINTSGCLALQTMTQWGAGGGGGGVHQLAFNNNDGLYWRFGASNSTNWDSWRKILTAGGNDFIDNQNATLQPANFSINGVGSASRMIGGSYDNGVTKLIAHGSSSSGMTLGSGANTTFGILGNYGLYGCYFGVDDSTGATWMQAGRTDGNTQVYNIGLQAGGGNVSIGNGYAVEKLQVFGNTKVSGSVFANRSIAGHDNGFTPMTVSNNATNHGTMTLGSPARTTFGVLGVNGSYGLFFGVEDSTGDTWIQGGRTDGNQSAYNILMQTAGGKVGIGTESPTEKLDINGSIKQSAVTGSMLKADADGKIVAATPGTDFAALRRGNVTFTGDGTTKVFTIPHGLGNVPGSVSLTPKSQLGNKMWFDGNGHVSAMDGTDITVTFMLAPANGANCEYWWVAYE